MPLKNIFSINSDPNIITMVLTSLKLIIWIFCIKFHRFYDLHTQSYHSQYNNCLILWLHVHWLYTVTIWNFRLWNAVVLYSLTIMFKPSSLSYECLVFKLHTLMLEPCSLWMLWFYIPFTIMLELCSLQMLWFYKPITIMLQLCSLWM